jgi:hypothetical protein
LVQGLIGIEAAIAYNRHKEEAEKKITGKDILNDYSKVKTLIKKYANDDTDRTDILRVACDNTVEEMKELEFLTETQSLNLKEFIFDLKKDLACSFVENDLLETPCFYTTQNGNVEESLSNDEEIFQYFKPIVESRNDNNKV